MQALRILFAAFVMLMPITGCVAQTAKVEAGRTAPNPQAAFVDEYKLGVGDRIRVLIYNEDAMSGEFQINAGGKVSLPLIGDINAVGRTTAEMAKVVRDGLAAGYLREPHVSVEVVTYRPYFILGEVKTPAQYPYVNGMTVINAVAVAGGFTPRATKRKVYIRRSGEDQEKLYDLTPELKVFPGDTIRLGERFF